MTTEVGSLNGLWRGSEPVRVGEQLDVELEFARPRSWSEITAKAELTGQGPATVQGSVMAIFDDEVIGATIGSAAVQIELDKPAPPDAVGQVVTLTTDDLEFHPTGL